jgi:hypothetical protein
MAWANGVRIAAIVVAIIVGLSPASATAAPPPNDTFAAATVIRSLPFSEIRDISEATGDADEAALALLCSEPNSSIRHVVWYAYTPAEDETIAVDTFASRPGAPTMIVTGTPGSFAALPGCSGSGLAALTAGTTYYIVAMGEEIPRGPATTLRLAVDRPKPPQIAATINRVARWVAGTAVLSGTISCSPGSFPTFGMTVVQAGPRKTRVVGFNDFSPEPFCNGRPQPWSLFAGSLDAPFKPGHAVATLKIDACTSECEVVELTRRVKLRDDGSEPGPGNNPPERHHRPRHPEPAS